MRPAYLITLIFLAGAYLALMRLDNTPFWDDEAYTAIAGKNFMKLGRLTGWDGRNLLAYRNGGLLDENLRLIDLPLSYFAAALSFRLFGISTWAGRFPFVLAGLGSVVLLALVLREDYREAFPLWVYGTAVLAFSVVFLLNIRQCRYYSLTMLFSLLTFYAYRQCLRKNQIVYFVVLAAAAALLFYSNFMLCGAFLLSLISVHLIFRHCELRKSWWKFSFAGGLFALATVPYAVCYSVWHRPDIRSTVIWYVRKLTLIWWNFRELSLQGYLPWVVTCGLVYFLFRYYKKEKYIPMMLEWAILSVGYITFLALVSPQPTEHTRIADVRYLAPAVPFLAGLTGVFLWFIHRYTSVGAIAVLVLIVTTNVLSITLSGWRFQWLLPAYINEIHHDYPTGYSQAVRFLQENTEQDDTVLAYPEYTNYPLMFYAGDKIKIGCVLENNSNLPLAKIKSLGAPLLIKENFPDWIILFGMFQGADQFLTYFSRPHPQGVREVKFSYKLAMVLDVYCYDTTRPELAWHYFGPKTDFNRRTEAVFVFKRSND